MRYIIMSADRRWTEAEYDNYTQAVNDWLEELLVGTHRLYIMAR